MLKIAVLAYENCQLSGIGAILDLFTLANWEYRRLNPQTKSPFCRCEVISVDGEPVNSFSRLPVQPKLAVQGCLDANLIVIPGMMGRPEQLAEQTELIAWVNRQYQRGALVASACSGAFLLAETGILNGRPATTHWQLAERFRQRYPEVDLQIDRMLVDGEDYLCAGGGSAHFDLALYLLGKLGSEALATSCARTMLLDRSRSKQAPFMRFRGRKNHKDQPILEVQQWLDRNYRNKVSIREMAESFRMNERTLLRRFRKATGEAPLEYLQRMRIETAKQLLASKKDSLEEITRYVGYEDVSSFRRLFREIVGMSPAAYRQRFSSW